MIVTPENARNEPPFGNPQKKDPSAFDDHRSAEDSVWFEYEFVQHPHDQADGFYE